MKGKISVILVAIFIMSNVSLIAQGAESKRIPNEIQIGKISSDENQLVITVMKNEIFSSRIISLRDSKTVKKLDFPTTFESDISNDFRKIVYVLETKIDGNPYKGEVFKYDIDSGTKKSITVINGFIIKPSFSPDGSKVMLIGYFRHGNDKKDPELPNFINKILLYSLDTGKENFLLSGEPDSTIFPFNSEVSFPLFHGSFGWSPDGKKFYFVKTFNPSGRFPMSLDIDTGKTQKFDAENGAVVGFIDEDTILIEHPFWLIAGMDKFSATISEYNLKNNSQKVLFSQDSSVIVKAEPLNIRTNAFQLFPRQGYLGKDGKIPFSIYGKLKYYDLASGKIIDVPTQGRCERPIYLKNANRLIFVRDYTEIVETDLDGNNERILFDADKVELEE